MKCDMNTLFKTSSKYIKKANSLVFVKCKMILPFWKINDVFCYPEGQCKEMKNRGNLLINALLILKNIAQGNENAA